MVESMAERLATATGSAEIDDLQVFIHDWCFDVDALASAAQGTVDLLLQPSAAELQHPGKKGRLLRIENVITMTITDSEQISIYPILDLSVVGQNKLVLTGVVPLTIEFIVSSIHVTVVRSADGTWDPE